MNAPAEWARWAEFPTECAYYLVLMASVHIPVFVFGSLVAVSLPRRAPNALSRRFVRFGLFVTLFLFVGSFFNGLWSCLIFDRLYHSADYFLDFVPFWPITQAIIDRTFGDEHGQLLGVTLRQLQIVWLLFALGTWGVTILLYKFLSRSLTRTEARTVAASRFFVFLSISSSLVFAAALRNSLTPAFILAAVFVPIFISWRVLRDEKVQTQILSG